jgi:hypothetical protein
MALTQVPSGMLAPNTSGNGPAFSAVLTGTQSITSSTATLMQFATEEFDSNSCFNNTGSTVGGIPAYAFKPTVAGYYSITLSIYPSTSTSDTQAQVFKNGTLVKRQYCSAINGVAHITILVQLDGVSDYIQGYGYITGTSPAVGALATLTYFQGSMIRAA